MGIAGRQFLVGWRDNRKRNTEPGDPSNQLTRGSHGCFSCFQAPVNKSWLQQRHLRPLRRQLAERFRRLAVLVGRQAILGIATRATIPIANNSLTSDAEGGISAGGGLPDS